MTEIFFCLLIIVGFVCFKSAPYKAGSKGTKAQRAKQLGLEPAALSLLQNPMELNLFSYIRPNTKGKCSASMSSNVLNVWKYFKRGITPIVLMLLEVMQLF